MRTQITACAWSKTFLRQDVVGENNNNELQKMSIVRARINFVSIVIELKRMGVTN